MNINLEGRVAIVTGAGQGIGASVAQIFADAGCNVVVANRNAANGQRIVDRITDSHRRGVFIQTDVGRKDQVSSLVMHTVEQYGRLDIVIHNAAYYPIAAIEDISEADLDQTLAVNLKAAFWLMQASLPYLREREQGRVIVTSSVTGNAVAMPGLAHYAASKSGLNGFIRTAGLEYAREHITVNGVEPGFISTEAMAALVSEDEMSEMVRYIPKGKLGRAEDIGNAMLFLASDDASYITGQTITVDGGATLPESPIVLEQFYREHGLLSRD